MYEQKRADSVQSSPLRVKTPTTPQKMNYLTPKKTLYDDGISFHTPFMRNNLHLREQRKCLLRKCLYKRKPNNEDRNGEAQNSIVSSNWEK
jgi:hypothetical protein